MILCQYGAMLQINDCIFENNVALRGGAVSCLEGSEVEITNCRFLNNHGGLSGGAIYICESDPVIGGDPDRGNEFIGNWSGAGADIFCGNTAGNAVNARHNVFSGHLENDYNVMPRSSFDLSGCATQTIPISENVYVSVDGDDSSDGLSWSTAFATIQHALSVTLGTQTNPLVIYIGPGVFSASATLEKFPLPLCSYVSLEGAGSTSTIVDAEFNEGLFHGFNAEYVNIAGLKLIQTERLPALSLIRSSNIDMQDCHFFECVTFEFVNGGGLWMQDSNASFENCRIDSCYALGGAGVACDNSSPDFANCIFENNETASFEGGGVYCSNGSNPSFYDCTFSNNLSVSKGGAVFCESSSPVFQNCTFIHNEANDGGGIACDNASPELVECTIRNNTVSKGCGGGVYCFNNSNPRFVDCILEFNSTLWSSGGAMYCQSSGPVFQRCKLSNNYAGKFGGAIACISSRPVIGGSEIDGNIFSSNWSGAGADLFCGDPLPDPVDARWNTFSGYMPSDYYITPAEKFDLTGSTSGLEPVLQDVYVTTDGDDSRDGLSWETSFKTIQYALSRVYGTEANPVIVHIGTGVFSKSRTGEKFPLPLISHVSLMGSGSTVLDIENPGSTEKFKGGAVMGCLDNHATVSGLTVTRGDLAGGIRLFDSSFITLWDIRFVENHADSRYTGNWGGGLLCVRSAPLIYNCFFDSNENIAPLGKGGGVVCIDSSPTIRNCTFVDNSADSDGGGIYCRDAGSSPWVQNCILWDNQPSEIAGDGSPQVMYSDIKGSYPGLGNLDADPLFVEGPLGRFYLSQMAAGQALNSPCVDSGMAPAMTSCVTLPEGLICMDTLSTRTDEYADEGTVDMGYHYARMQFPATPTPTPVPTSTPGCSDTGVSLWMPSHNYQPGDPCGCRVTVCNASGNELERCPLFVILSVSGEYYFAPGFTMEVDNYLEQNQVFPVGETSIEVVPWFHWPSGAGTASGIIWYAGVTDPVITQILGNWDSWEFGWTE